MAHRIGAALLVLALSAPGAAAACATCGSGDPTLTTMGLGQAYGGRLRFGLRLRYRWDSLQIEGSNAVELHEARAALSAAYSFDDRVTLSATMPVVLRRAAWASLRAYTTLGPSDLALSGRFVLLRDRAFSPSHLLGVTVGVSLPTSVDQANAQGRRLPVDVQSGSGVVGPSAGIFYNHLAAPSAFFASAVVSVPLAGRFDESPGLSLRGSIAGQQRLTDWLSLREGVHARWDSPSRIGDRTDPRSDHFTLFVAPDVLLAPATDWVIAIGARIPVLQLSEQGRQEGWMFLSSITVDA